MGWSKLHKKVLLDLLSSPWTLVPSALGASALLLAWAADSGSLAFFGVSGILAGIGALATQWIYRADEFTKKAFESLEAEAVRQRQSNLDQLDLRLQEDDDPRPEESLRELRAMYDGFQRDAGWRSKVGAPSVLEISNKVENLFRACIISLQRSQELWDTARKMRTTEMRSTVLESRERLLDEVRRSVGQLARTIDGVHALALDSGQDGHLAQIRQELDESLEVARRVEQRMQSLDEELGRASERIRE